ncbi:hypothetical protein Tco_1105310 [Tanacetum coccineum]
MSSVGKIVHDSNKAPDSPPHPHTISSNQRHCFHCKDVLGDGEFCQRCTCVRCGSGLSKGLCLICASRYGNNPNPNSLNDSPNISKNVSQSPPLIDHHCCYECGDSLDDIFCQRCTCKSCGNGAHYGYNCPPKIPICYDDDDDDEYTIEITPDLSTEEPDNSLSMGDEHLDTIPETESDEVIKSSVKDLVPIPSESEGIPDKMCDVPFRDNSPPLDISKDQFEGFSDSNNDSTSIDDDSFSIDDIDYVEASPPDSELVSLEEVKDFHTEGGEIEDNILREKLSKINILIAMIEAINSNPPPSSDFVTKSPSIFSNSFLKETNTFDNSIPESETFCFDLEENSSGSTTTRSDYSLPDYEAFYFDDNHIKENSSGSTTTHSDISLSKYDLFIFDLSNDPFPPADRSDFYHEEFADELAHIISPLEYDCFYFKSEPDPGELTSIVDSVIRENVSSMTNVNLLFEDDQSPLLAYVVWIFLLFLTYPVTPPYLLSCGNEDTIFDPGIFIYHSFMPSVSHRSGTFMKFNVYPNNLNESPMEILSSTCSPMDQ